uniref:Cytochrome c oxidase subunit 2 n=1 Tax=Pauropus longiramus TaxID=933850 RepID=G9BG41_9MYRI|nr:cytochrome c oxidase subunit II [Pauropus longiramus]ADT63079.1 cytochrome c oxidase subunit II [Pauropus longiramus]
MTTWNAINFQESASPSMSQMMFFHDHLMLVLCLIITLIIFMMSSLVYNNNNSLMTTEAHNIEILWTITPAFILIVIALPSLKILYLTEENFNPNLTIKTIANQWFWSYEYSDFSEVEFDSYMLNLSSLNYFRLLDVDNRINIPLNVSVRNLITSNDVIHAWAVPSLAVKLDAVPGRLNQTNFIINRPGLFYGQCSEICGANHSFMPIVIETCSLKNFFSWLNSI